MKKQIFFLPFFVLAIIAGTSTTFGQTTSLTPGVTDPTGTNQFITPLSCVASSEALHPYPGVPYTYTMDGESGIETTNEWTWFATKDPVFIDALTNTLNTAGALTVASGDLLAAGANYATATVDANSITITWSPEILANTVYNGAAGEPTFVVGYATGDNCADNIQIYQINPLSNFIIDIANIDPTSFATLGWDATTSSCVDIVRSATYNTTTFEVDMDYGTNVLYFEVAAANFVTDFTPTFRVLGGLTDVQTAVMSMHTTLTDAQDLTSTGVGTPSNWAAGDVAADGTGTAWATGEQFDAVVPADAVTGVSLYVRVVISNLTYESLTDNPFILAVDAQDQTETGIWDMEDGDCDPLTATDAADWVDLAQHTVTPRPQIDGTTPDAGTPNPTTTIPKPSTTTAPNF